jgi:iron complex outermembrane receptor protein
LTSGGLALGQTETPKPDKNGGAGNNGEVAQVVVTAQKREQSLTQVPVAISAFTSTERDKIGIDSVQDMTNFTPGFSYNTGNDRVTLRGIGRYTNQLGADSSVGVYEDGAFETFTVKAGNDSIFVDRIEVLRGPQGTLYGRNSIGGAINIISRRPTKDFYGEVRTLYDNYGQHIEEGAFSGPLTDNVQFRVSGSKTDQEDGYFNNLAGGHGDGNVRDEYYVEGQLAAQFGAKADLWIKVFNGAWDNAGGNAGGRITNQVVTGPDGRTPTNGAYPVNTLGGCLTADGCLATDILVPSLGSFNQPGVTNVVSFNGSGLNPGNSNIRNIYEIQKQTVTLHGYEGMELQFNYHFTGFDLKYIGQVQHYAYETHEPWGEGDQLDTGVVSYKDPQGITTYPLSQLWYGEYHFFTTNEFNLISNNDSPLQWVAGFYNFNESYTQPEQIVLPGQTQLAAPIFLTGAAAPANPTQSAVYQEAQDGAETFAGFGQIDYKVTSTVKLTLGLRYSYDSKWGIDSVRYVIFGPQLGVPLPVAFDVTQLFVANTGAQPGASAAQYNAATGFLYRKLSGDWSGLTGTAGVQWDPDRDTNLYAKYSRGFKSGGFNAGSGLATDPETKPEFANDYQVGFKKNIGRSFNIAIDAFYDQYYDAQLPVSVSNGALLSSEFYNMPEARSDGVEVEGNWSPTKALNLLLSYGFNDTSIVKSGCIEDNLGDPTATLAGAQPGSCPVLAGGVRGQNLKGDQLPNAPRNKVALNATYSLFFEPGTLTFSGSYIWRDEQYGSVFNRAWNLAPSWDQVDLRATWTAADHHWTVIAYGKNIFNTTGYGSGAIGTLQSNGDYIKEFVLNPPAVGGIELQYKF